MAFQNIDSQQLGKLLQIAFSEGVRSQISKDFRDWEFIKMNRVGDPQGRELRFQLQTSYGPSAIQYRNPNSVASFPSAQKATIGEKSAVYKEIDATIELEYNLWNRARKSKDVLYMEPLALEIQSKTVAAKRRMAADLYGDGTGVMLQVSSVVDAASSVAVTALATNAARGFVGFCEFGDLLLPFGLAGASAPVAPTVSGGTFYAFRVTARDRRLNKVTLEPVDASGNVLGLTASNLVATNVFYRIGQPTIPDLTAAIADYGSVTEVMAGLESLAAADGRVIWGITQSGATAGSRYDAGDVQIDVSHLQAAMSNAKTIVGQGQYAWKNALMAPETLDAFIESRETDRRFTTMEDSKRGTKSMGYQHGQDFLEFITSEYCPKKRMYMLPEAKSGEGKVLEYYGTDFEPVRINNSDEFMLKPSSSGGHQRVIVSYLEALCTLVCKHPAAIAVVENFNLA
jgi:hypothetical protein